MVWYGMVRYMVPYGTIRKPHEKLGNDVVPTVEEKVVVLICLKHLCAHLTKKDSMIANMMHYSSFPKVILVLPAIYWVREILSRRDRSTNDYYSCRIFLDIDIEFDTHVRGLSVVKESRRRQSISSLPLH